MIIVLGYDKDSGASAKRLASRYNEILVLKDGAIIAKQHDLRAATPKAKQGEFGNLRRITILGHSNSTNKFGSYTVPEFTDLICKILESNTGCLTNLTVIDLFGCEVGRIERLPQTNAAESLSVMGDQYRSFVSDVVDQLNLRACAYIANDLNIYAFSTPEDQLYRKTLLYEDIINDEEPGKWLYLGLNDKQYEQLCDLEGDESVYKTRIIALRESRAKLEDSLDYAMQMMPSEEFRSPEHALIKENLNNRIIEIQQKISNIDEKIQLTQTKYQQKHMEIRTFLLNVPTQIITSTNDPREVLETTSFCKFVIHAARAEEKFPSTAGGEQEARTGSLVEKQIDLKEGLESMKSSAQAESKDATSGTEDFSAIGPPNSSSAKKK